MGAFFLLFWACINHGQFNKYAETPALFHLLVIISGSPGFSHPNGFFFLCMLFFYQYLVYIHPRPVWYYPEPSLESSDSMAIDRLSVYYADIMY